MKSFYFTAFKVLNNMSNYFYRKYVNGVRRER